LKACLLLKVLFPYIFWGYWEVEVLRVIDTDGSRKSHWICCYPCKEMEWEQGASCHYKQIGYFIYVFLKGTEKYVCCGDLISTTKY
jgi:hypothetical protein